MKHIFKSFTFLVCLFLVPKAHAQDVPEKVMKDIYEQVKTPYKYGMVIAPEDNSQKADCPTVFRRGDSWYMSYIIFNGRGYETWLADSEDLLHWKTRGRILSFSDDTTRWDNNQKAGYVGLQDYKWGGSYQLQQYIYHQN